MVLGPRNPQGTASCPRDICLLWTTQTQQGTSTSQCTAPGNWRSFDRQESQTAQPGTAPSTHIVTFNPTDCRQDHHKAWLAGSPCSDTQTPRHKTSQEGTNIALVWRCQLYRCTQPCNERMWRPWNRYCSSTPLGTGLGSLRQPARRSNCFSDTVWHHRSSYCRSCRSGCYVIFITIQLDEPAGCWTRSAQRRTAIRCCTRWGSSGRYYMTQL
jgi:hypothetical protein